MEYVIGPVFAILVSLPFTHFKTVQTEEKIKALQTKIELIETNHSERLEKVESVVQIIDREVPKENGWHHSACRSSSQRTAICNRHSVRLNEKNFSERCL